MKLTHIGFLGLLALVASGAQAAKPVFTETYNVSPVECDGLTLDGVTYSFTVAGSPSADCKAGTLVGPGTSDSISPPNIEGTAAGVLHLNFINPPPASAKGGVVVKTAAPLFCDGNEMRMAV